MSATTVVDDSLRLEIERVLRETARHRGALAARIKADLWHEAIDLVAANIAVPFDDAEVAVIVALGRVLNQRPDMFVPFRGKASEWKKND